MSSFTLRSAPDEKAHKKLLVRVLEKDTVIVHAGGPGESVDFSEVFANGIAVVARDEGRVYGEGFVALHVDKAGGTFEREVEFLPVEKVDHSDVMFPESEVLDGVAEFVCGNE
jgi:hypothetical protein